MRVREALHELLVARFSSGFERFVHTYFEPCFNDVPWAASLNKQVHEFLRAISARGLEESLWPALREVRPTFIEDIDAIAARWVAEAPEVPDGGAGPEDERADNCVLEPEAYYDRGELASHAHAYAPRAFGGAAEALDELTRWLARPEAGAFFVISGPGGSGKSRLCLEAAKTTPLRWINVRAYRHRVKGLVRRLRRRVERGCAYVYEDQQEFRTAFEEVAGVIAEKGARLVILSREHDEPIKAVRYLGSHRAGALGDASQTTLRAIVDAAGAGASLPAAVRDRIVHISHGRPATAVLAVAHVRAGGTLVHVESVDELFETIYDDLQRRAGEKPWPALRPQLGRLALLRGLPRAEVAHDLRTILTEAYLVEGEDEDRIRPDDFAEFIAKRTYFAAGMSPELLPLLDGDQRPREIMTTLVAIQRANAARILIARSTARDVGLRIDLALAALAGFSDAAMIEPLLATLAHDALAVEDADRAHAAATLMFALSRFDEAAELWQRAALLCERAGNHWGLGQVLKELGRCHQAGGRIADARAAFVRALEAVSTLAPGLAVYESGVIHNELGALAAAQDEWRGSLQELEQARKAFEALLPPHRASGLAATYLQEGWTWLGAGNVAEAARCFDQSAVHAAELDDPGAQARAAVARASVMLQRGAFADAANQVRDTLALLRTLGEVWLPVELAINHARACSAAARWTEASSHYSAALDESRRLGSKQWEATALTGLGDVAWMSGEPEAACERYQQAIAMYRSLGLARDAARLTGRRARVLHALEDVSAAFAESDRALDELARVDDRVGQTDALVARGSMHAYYYQWDEAVEAYDRALALWPESEVAHRVPVIAGIARLLENRGHWRDAVDAYRGALAAYMELGDQRGIANMHASLGELRRCLGQDEPAIAEYDAALAHQPQAAALYAARAEVHFRWGRYDEAERDLARATELDPRAQDIMPARAWMCIHQGRHDEAVRLVDEQLDKRPARAYLWNIRGYAHYRSGDYRACVDDYEHALEHAPHGAVLYAVRGRAYARVGRFDDAERDFDTARALRPALRELFWVEYDGAAAAAVRGATTDELLERLRRAMALPYWDGDCICHARMTEHLAWDPDFAALRDAPGFAELLDDRARRAIAASLPPPPGSPPRAPAG